MNRILAVMLSLAASTAMASEVGGQARVVDGDTLVINETRIRLHGLDAPESHQTCLDSGIEWSCGQAATEWVRSFIAGLPVHCTWTDTDPYGRLLAVCFVHGENLNSAIVRNGWAIAYTRYSRDYVGEQAAAKAEHLGVWRAGNQFEEPWRWRREHH